MHKNKTLILGSAFVALTISGAAGATTISYDSQLDSNGVPMTTVAGATTVDFNGGSCAQCSGNFDVVSGSVSGRYSAPYTGSAPDATQYLTVPKNLSSTPQSATFALGTTANYFSLLWGSIDSYNTLAFLNGGSQVASFTGSDVANPPPASGNQTSAANNTFVNFSDLPTFDSVKLSSTNYAFEADNFAYGTVAVPEPGNLALFALAALGLLAAFRRRISNRMS